MGYGDGQVYHERPILVLFHEKHNNVTFSFQEESCYLNRCVNQSKDTSEFKYCKRCQMPMDIRTGIETDATDTTSAARRRLRTS